MSLGKRSRAPIRRTTSMSEITFDLGDHTSEQPAPSLVYVYHNSLPNTPKPPLLSPRGDLLRACSLCNRPLLSGRDIYMYRGDKGSCSEECRKKQMKQDERVEKCSTVASKKAAAVSSSSPAVPPQISTKGETVAAS